MTECRVRGQGIGVVELMVIETAGMVEVVDGGGEFITFLTFEKELSDPFASAFVLDRRGGFFLLLVLVLVVDGTEAIVWVANFVLCFCELGFDFPHMLLFEWKCLPTVADYFREGAMVSLDRARDVLLADEIGAEEHESIWRTRDVAQRRTFSGRDPTTSRGRGRVVRWGKEGERWREMIVY